ncbi:MAG: Npt1/Npt2 family nucleotide transporter [Alphaproteobacteria bacterium]|nr:Npt1/Npt2 family nucleotide transporter [Alphaproteobacteria bacterium]
MVNKEFSPLRAVFFPIHGSEIRKFMPLAIIMMLILFNFYILHNTKDAIIIASEHSGAEVLNFIKIYGVLPIAFIFFFAYTYLSNLFRMKTIFYSILAFFAIFFLVFAFLIYPNREFLHPNPDLIEQLKLANPRFQWFFPLYGYWTYTLFYIIADLWGSIVVAYLFWQFANQITRIDEAPRFYPMFNLIGAGGILMAGFIGSYYSQIFDVELTKEDAWGVSLKYLLSFFAVSCALIVLLHMWIHRNIMTDPQYYDAYQRERDGKEQDVHLSFFESLKYIFTSRYILLILLITIGYQISINLMEVSWKAQIKELNPSNIEFSKYMGNFTIKYAFISIIITIISTNIVRKTPWLIGALVTPFILGITGLFFFLALLLPETLDPMLVYFGASSLVFTVWMGSTQSVLTKTTKNCLFNATREMVYIPLDDELKVKGKAAVDVIAERLGKSGGAVIQQVLLIMTAGAQKDILPYLCVIVVIMMVLWVGSIFNLNKHFTALVKKMKTSNN